MDSSALETASPPKRKAQHPKGAAIVQYENEYEKLNNSYQLKWSNLMENGHYMTSSFYTRVKVLLISWDEESDDLDTKDEVARLRDVFTKTFRFQVTPALIKKDPEHAAHLQVVRHVNNFLWNEDRANTLLIVYYAGHGVSGSPGILTLTGKRSPSDSIEDRNEIIWNNIDNMFEHIKADMLEIFDCCYAGDLGRNQQAWGMRCSEFLGATSSQSTTMVPGKHSFTSALIWALETLAREQERFTVSGLSRKIREAPDFPSDQVPVHFDRGMHSIERIVLAPLSEKSQANPPSPNDLSRSSPQGLLSLNFVFEAPPTVQDIEKLGNALNRVMYKNQMPVSRIVWGGFGAWGGNHPSPGAGSSVIKAANQFKKAGERRRRLSSKGKLN